MLQPQAQDIRSGIGRGPPPGTCAEFELRWPCSRRAGAPSRGGGGGGDRAARGRSRHSLPPPRRLELGRGPSRSSRRFRLPRRRGRPELAAVAGAGHDVRGGRPGTGRQRPDGLVHAVCRGRRRPRAPARTGHHGTERPARHQPDVEQLGAAARGGTGAGHVARRPAGQPHGPGDARLRRLGYGHVLAAAAARRQRGGRRPGRCGIRLFPWHGERGHRSLRNAVRRARAPDDRGRDVDHHRARPLAHRRGLAGAARRRTGVHRGRDAFRRRHRVPGAGGGARREPSAGRASAAGRGSPRSRRGRRGRAADLRLRPVDAVPRPARRARNPLATSPTTGTASVRL